MKKVLKALAVAAVMVALVTSCSQKVEDGLATVKFAQGIARDIFASVSYPTVESLTWTLTAEKLDKGSTVGAGVTEGVLLTDEFGPYSIGRWSFTFDGYSDDGTLVYSGSVSGLLAEGGNTLTVDLEPQGEKGTLLLTGCNFIAEDEDSVYNSMIVYVDGEKTDVFNGAVHCTLEDGYYKCPARQYEIAPGVHDVEIVIHGNVEKTVEDFKVRIVAGLTTSVTAGTFEGTYTLNFSIEEQEALVEEE